MVPSLSLFSLLSAILIFGFLIYSVSLLPVQYHLFDFFFFSVHLFSSFLHFTHFGVHWKSWWIKICFSLSPYSFFLRWRPLLKVFFLVAVSGNQSRPGVRGSELRELRNLPISGWLRWCYCYCWLKLFFFCFADWFRAWNVRQDFRWWSYTGVKVPANCTGSVRDFGANLDWVWRGFGG